MASIEACAKEDEYFPKHANPEKVDTNDTTMSHWQIRKNEDIEQKKRENAIAMTKNNRGDKEKRNKKRPGEQDKKQQMGEQRLQEEKTER